MRQWVGDVEEALRRRPFLHLGVHRLIGGVLTLFFVSILVFGATALLPGNAARSILGPHASHLQIVALDRQLHLSGTLFSEYGSWLAGMLSGHLGTSLATGLPVGSVIRPELLNSATLVVISAVVSLTLSIGFGLLAAVKRDKTVDHASSLVALLLTAVPDFVLATVVIIIFATLVFHLLPGVSTLTPGEYAWNDPRALVLPSLSLVLVTAPYPFRMTRATLIEALESDYVEMARLKNVPEWRVVLQHALPNALAPVAQVGGLVIIYLAGGIVVIESVFTFPGIGQGLVNAVQRHDEPIVQATVLLLAAVYVIVNIGADVIALALSPERRVAG